MPFCCSVCWVCACANVAMRLVTTSFRYRLSLLRKWDKGERFQMQFEDGKMYAGVVMGCVDCVVVDDPKVPARDLGMPWEALQVRVLMPHLERCAQCEVLLLHCVFVCVFVVVRHNWRCCCVVCGDAVAGGYWRLQVRWDDGDESAQLVRLNPWETVPLPNAPKPSRMRLA